MCPMAIGTIVYGSISTKAHEPIGTLPFDDEQVVSIVIGLFPLNSFAKYTVSYCVMWNMNSIQGFPSIEHCSVLCRSL